MIGGIGYEGGGPEKWILEPDGAPKKRHQCKVDVPSRSNEEKTTASGMNTKYKVRSHVDEVP